jgi:hypothetical protein
MRNSITNSTDRLTEYFNSSIAYFNAVTGNITPATAVSRITHVSVRSVNETQSTYWTPINITYLIIGIIGIVGNLFSCVVIARYPPLRKRLANYFIINQCFLDLVTAVSLVINLTIDQNLKNLSGVSLSVACYLVNTRIFYTSAFAASIWNLSALAAERYFKIVHAVRHKTSVTKTKIVVACVAVWVFAFLYRSCATMLPVSVGDGVCRVAVFTSVAVRQVQGVSIFLVDFFLPTSTIAFCYVQLTRKLRKVNASSTVSSSLTSSGARRNIIRLLVIVSLTFLITVGPRQIMVLYYVGLCYSTESKTSRIVSLVR